MSPSMLRDSDYLHIAAEGATSYRDRLFVEYEPCVKVGLTVLGPDNVTRVPCGEATFPRCDADEFLHGILTITSQDDGSVLREYQPGVWIEATAYDRFGHIAYYLKAGR